MLLEDHFVKGRKQHKMQAMISSDKIASDNTLHFQLARTPFTNINVSWSLSLTAILPAKVAAMLNTE